MDRIITIVGKFFNYIFVAGAGNRPGLIQYLINRITNNDFLLIGAVCLIIGFSVSLIKRIIHS